MNVAISSLSQPQRPTPPSHLTPAVERLLDNASLRGDLTDDQYRPLLDATIDQLEQAAARLPPGPQFEREARLITGRLMAAVRETELDSLLPANGSGVYRALQTAAADGLLDAREAQRLVRTTFRAPMSNDDLATLQRLFAAERNRGVTIAAPHGPALRFTVTAEAYRVLAEAVGFVAFPK